MAVVRVKTVADSVDTAVAIFTGISSAFAPVGAVHLTVTITVWNIDRLIPDPSFSYLKLDLYLFSRECNTRSHLTLSLLNFLLYFLLLFLLL